jgi:Cu/Ag efflux protein CusF
MNHLRLTAATLAAILCLPAGLQAQPAPKPATPSADSASASPEWIHAEITRIDLARKRVTLKHAPIASIKMAAMTMPFKVQEAALLDGYKVGDKLQVVVKDIDGDLFVTQVRKAAN